jgi:hypothetical protein
MSFSNQRHSFSSSELMHQEPDSDGDGQDVKGGKGDKGDKKGVINRVNRKSILNSWLVYADAIQEHV